jgi:glycogen(starch) synthase
LLIAGDGSLRRALEEQAASQLAPRSYRLLGHWADVSTFHHALDLLVQSSDYEGTPNAVLEAMAFGTPVVATAAGGTDQLVTDGVHGRVLAPGDATTLAAAIEAALRDPEAARTRAAAARTRIETDLSFERRMQRLEAVYDALAAERERRGLESPRRVA